MVNANIINTGWWTDPAVWLIAAVIIMIMTFIAIYYKVFLAVRRS